MNEIVSASAARKGVARNHSAGIAESQMRIRSTVTVMVAITSHQASSAGASGNHTTSTDPRTARITEAAIRPLW